MKKIVVKVPMSTCGNNKPLILKTVAKLEGINSMNIDDEKGTLTVVGNVDPVCIITVLRKKKMSAEIDSVGEDKKEEKEDKDKDKDKEKECEELFKKITECGCTPFAQPVPYMPYRNMVCYEEPQYGCVIS